MRRSDRERREARERSLPVERLSFKLVGVRYGGRQSAIAREGVVGASVVLMREPWNPHGRGLAVSVRGARSGVMLGYVPQEDAEELAPLLDSGLLYLAEVTEHYGYKAVVPIVSVRLFRADSGVAGATRALVLSASSGAGRLLGWLVIAVVLAICGVAGLIAMLRV